MGRNLPTVELKTAIVTLEHEHGLRDFVKWGKI